MIERGPHDPGGAHDRGGDGRGERGGEAQDRLIVRLQGAVDLVAVLVGTLAIAYAMSRARRELQKRRLHVVPDLEHAPGPPGEASGGQRSR